MKLAAGEEIHILLIVVFKGGPCLGGVHTHEGVAALHPGRPAVAERDTKGLGPDARGRPCVIMQALTWDPCRSGDLRL